MNGKPLISIAIPTYNRASSLKNLLSHICVEAERTNGLVQICISNNGSSDNTQEVVANFQKRFQGLIKYNENAENLGVDKNVIKVMEMSAGDFVWLFGDDDMIVPVGIQKVVDFIKNCCNSNTGFIMLSHQSYLTDHKGKSVTHFSTLEKNKPPSYQMRRKEVMGMRLINAFLSIMLFNNDFLKTMLREERAAIQEAIGNYYVHAFIYQLMLLKYKNLKVLKLNEIIIREDLHYSKFYVEDRFKVYYAGRKKLDDLLLASKYMDENCRKVFIKEKNKLAPGHIKEMAAMKAFGAFNFFSFLGCIKLFFSEADFINALLFSAFFIIFYLTPSFILKNLYKNFIRIKYKSEWENIWFHIVVTNSMMSKGSRRLTC